MSFTQEEKNLLILILEREVENLKETIDILKDTMGQEVIMSGIVLRDELKKQQLDYFNARLLSVFELLGRARLIDIID